MATDTAIAETPYDRRRSDAVDQLTAAHARMCAAQEQYVRALAEVGDCVGSSRSLTSEVGLALRISEGRAFDELGWASALVRHFPHTLAALRAGTIDLYKAFIVAELTVGLSAEQLARADELLVQWLEKTPGNLRRAVHKVIRLVDPEGDEQRRKDREDDRKVVLSHREHGWSLLSADLPCHKASAIYQSLTDAAKELRRTDPSRTMDQLRADILADRLMGAATGGSSVKAQVYVYVDLFSLWSLNNDPGYLPGYGHIPAEIARQIAAEPTSTWSRLITDPDTGQLLSVGRTKYRPPADLADYVRIRARTCEYPGCNEPAQFVDIDHTEDWAKGGETDADTLGGRCRYHHLLKNEPGWRYETKPDGTTVITTPAGRTYTSKPEPFHEPRHQNDEPPPP